MKDSDDSNEASQNIAAVESGDVKYRDGAPTIPIAGSQISENKVDGMLQKVNLSYHDLGFAQDEKAIKENIQQLKTLLNRETVQADKEMRFMAHAMLGTQYSRLYTKNSKQEYIDQAVSHTDSAISLFEGQPEYKADLAPVYHERAIQSELRNNVSNAVSLKKFLIEKFQGIGYGPYNNWFASFHTRGLYKLSRSESLASEKKQEIVDYLGDIAEQYDNEVGVAAQVALVWHHFDSNHPDKVDALSETVGNRLASLDNQAFEEDHWDLIKTRMERAQKMKSPSKN